MLPLAVAESRTRVSPAIDSGCELRCCVQREEQRDSGLRKLGESTKKKSEREGGKEGAEEGAQAALASLYYDT